MYIVIAGGGVLGYGLSKRLVDARHDVVVVEQDRTVCERIATSVGALAIHGAATSIEVLEEAKIQRAEAAVGALTTDADNLAFGVLARNFAVPQVLARMRNPAYASAYKLAGVSRAINVSDMLVPQLMLEIEQPTVRIVATFGEGKAAIAVVTVPAEAEVSGQNVQEIVRQPGFPDDCVIAGIIRQGSQEFVFPRGGAEIHAGDRVFLAAPTDTVRRAANTLMTCQ